MCLHSVINFLCEVSMAKLPSPQSLAITAAAVHQIDQVHLELLLLVVCILLLAIIYDVMKQINYPINQLFLLIYRVVFLFAFDG